MIEIKKVTDKRGLKDFIQFRYDLYRNDPYDVPYLYSDEEFTLRKDKNASFDVCDADYFLAYKDGKIVGRVAAIINRSANELHDKRIVRFGWFDFIDDKEVSRRLIETVEQWGKEHGMDTIVGPMGFMDTDREGLLVDGFKTYGTSYANYNYPYYVDHIESMDGFAKDNDYVQCHVKVPEAVPEKMAKVAEMIKKRYNLKVHKLSREELIKGGYGYQVFNILNVCYKDLYGFSPLNDRKVKQLVDQYIRIADLNLVCTVMDGNADDKMIGFGITFPSISDALRKTRDGRLLPFGWYHLLKAIKKHTADTVDLLLVGVLPEYRSKGANAIIFDDLIRQYISYGFKWAEALPMMETNNKVLSQWDYLESTRHRRLRCYKRSIK